MTSFSKYTRMVAKFNIGHLQKIFRHKILKLLRSYGASKAQKRVGLSEQTNF